MCSHISSTLINITYDNIRPCWAITVHGRILFKLILTKLGMRPGFYSSDSFCEPNAKYVRNYVLHIVNTVMNELLESVGRFWKYLN
jgi:hypothetical protein